MFSVLDSWIIFKAGGMSAFDPPEERTPAFEDARPETVSAAGKTRRLKNQRWTPPAPGVSDAGLVPASLIQVKGVAGAAL